MRDVPATLTSSHKSRFLCPQTRVTVLPFLFAQRLAQKRRVLPQIFGTSFAILLAGGFEIAGLTIYLARPRRLASKRASIMPSRISRLRIGCTRALFAPFRFS